MNFLDKPGKINLSQIKVNSLLPLAGQLSKIGPEILKLGSR